VSPDKTFRTGTHRTVAPEATLARAAPLMPVLGITRVANITGLDGVGIPVAVASRPNARSLSVSQGKGLTLAAAKASAVMEALELYHAERVHRPLLFASEMELCRSQTLIATDGLPRAKGGRYHPGYPLLWVEGHCLLDDVPTWVPFELVHTNACDPAPPGSGCFACTSNGLASGNHRLEAVSHALCEVIERDATTLWRALPPARRQATRVDPSTIDDPDCLDLLRRFDRFGIEVLVWETTSDIGIPAFLCTIFERTTDPARMVYNSNGMGCHPSKPIALARALTEAAQSRLTLIAGSRDDVFDDQYQIPPNGAEILSTLKAAQASPTPRSYRDIPSYEHASFADDVAWVLGRLRAVGICSAVCVDLTRPELGIPVVRVVVPGLEGCDEVADYVPGARAAAARAVRGEEEAA
jgi:YcaO-like protein with predicted kinase domain